MQTRVQAVTEWVWQLDAKKGLSCTLGDIEQVQQVLKTVIPPESVADDSDAQAMRTRVEQLGLLAVFAYASVCVAACHADTCPLPCLRPYHSHLRAPSCVLYFCVPSTRVSQWPRARARERERHTHTHTEREREREREREILGVGTP
jgi:hypothetical protein